MEKEQKVRLGRILLSAALLLAAWLLPTAGWVRLVSFLVPYAVAGYDVVWEAAEKIFHGELFEEDFLMALATIGAFAIGEYPEAVFVMVFFQVGELFEDMAVDKSRRSIEELMDIRPDSANLERGGQLLQVSPQEVHPGDIFVVKPGEKVPLDGTVVSGASSLNTMALTGESMPRDVAEGDAVISGCVSLTGVLRVRADKEFGESTVSKILKLVEDSAASKAKSESFITKFAHWYTPAVVLAAVILGLVPPLFVGNWAGWINRALIFLVISCPCALVISVPLTFFGGIGGASRRGILVKGGSYLEALSNAQIVVFDKTGTLTKGSFFVTTVHPMQCPEAELLELAAMAEAYSNHPISLSIREAYGKPIDEARVSDLQELAGHGVSAVIDGRRVLVGNERLMQESGVTVAKCTHDGTMIHVAADGVYLGHIVISDEPKEDAADAIRLLREQGVQKTVMLTGDRESVARSVAAKLGVDEVHAELLPEDKVAAVEELLKQTTGQGRLLLSATASTTRRCSPWRTSASRWARLGSDAAIEAATPC
jgi:Cd2+/Zn2+-exporting ATPase